MKSKSKSANQKSKTEIKKFRGIVLKHWKEHGRHSLPWRQTTDPYAILVSEVMLQQTQVDRVIPFYENFLKLFPTVRALAWAPLSEVLRAWSGLGYNRRAKLLQQSAVAIVEKYAGVFPNEYEALLALPGIGPYTAAAIRVFAFDESAYVIETNIRTAFTHNFFPRAKNVPDSRLEPLIRMAAEGASPRLWHSALMDYGASLKRSGIRINHKSAHYTKQSKFEGSLRQARGAILRELLSAPMSERRLKAKISLKAELIQEALTALQKQHMIAKTNTQWHLARE